MQMYVVEDDFPTIEDEAEQLEFQAEFRAQKAVEYSRDERNANAAAHLLVLVKQMRELKGTDLGNQFQHAQCLAYNDAVGSYNITVEWERYRSGIGFHNFPQTAADYVRDVMKIMRDGSPETDRVMKMVQECKRQRVIDDIMKTIPDEE
jgi:hypothetical protein